MAYTTAKNASGLNEVFQDGNRIATGTDAILANYGLPLPAGAQSVSTSTSTKIPIPQQPPAYISSTDVAGQFANDKKFIDQRTQQQTGQPAPAPVAQPTTTQSSEQSKNLQTYQDKVAAGQAQFDVAREQETAEAKASLDSTLAGLGAEYQSTKLSITNQFADLLKKTERLKNLDVGRRQAYGLGSAMYDPMGHTDAISLATNEWNGEISQLQTAKEAALQRATAAYEQGKAGALAASRKEIQDIETRIGNKTSEFSTRLAEELKTKNEQLKLKYQEFDERGQLAAQKALLQFAAYKSATSTDDKNKIITDAINAVGGDPNNITEFSAVKAALDGQITAEAKAEYDAKKQQLDLKKTETDIAHTIWTERRAENQDYINTLMERAKLGDTTALASLGINTDPSSKVRLSTREAATIQKDLSNDPNLQAINKAMDTWRSLSEYEAQVKETGANSIFSPLARGKAATKYQTAILNAKEYFNLGVLNGPDLSILEKVLPGVNTITPFAPFIATTAIGGIDNLKTQFSDKLDNDYLAVASRFSNYDPAQVPGLLDLNRKFIQTKAEIDPRINQLIEENPDLTPEDIIQIINNRL